MASRERGEFLEKAGSVLADAAKNMWWAFALLAFAGGIGAVGDAILNHWVKTHRTLWLFVSFIFWIAAASCFAWLLKCERFTFGAAVVLGLLVHLTLAVILDRIYFGGRFTFWQWIGFLCAMTAIILMAQGNTNESLPPILESTPRVAAETR